MNTLADPLLDLGLFASRAFSAAVGAMLFGTMLMGAIMLFVTQYLRRLGASGSAVDCVVGEPKSTIRPGSSTIGAMIF
jgi:uncharacterized membrane protein